MMRGGHELRGFASEEMPPNRARALDYLNTRVGFFSLAAKGRTMLVHRIHVRVARPLS